jgi:hypothetical protein
MVLTCAAVALLARRGVGAESRATAQKRRVADLVTKVAQAAKEVAGLLAANGEASADELPAGWEGAGPVLPSLTGSWVEPPLSLSPSFVADFKQFADLEELSRTIARAAKDVRSKGSAAVTPDLAKNLDAYHKGLKELAAFIGSSATIVVSGGVSLGSYQAGFLHYYTQFLLAQSAAVRAYGLEELTDGGGVRIATGASAGSINSFLSTLTRCRSAVADPRKSLFWSAWIPVGFHNLIDLEKVGVDSVLTQAPIEAAIGRLEPLWRERQELSDWSHDCDAVLGLSATRLRARQIDFSDGPVSERTDALRLKRQTEKFLLSVHGVVSHAPTFAPFRPSQLATGDGDESPIDMVYPTLGEHGFGVKNIDREISNSFDEVSTLLRASAAFPIAFSPVPVKLTVWRRARAGGYVPLEHGPVPFVDGGIFDNTPIGLAVKIQGWLRDRNETAPTHLMFLSSDAVGWIKPAAGSSASPEGVSLLDHYTPFLGDFVTTAEQTELLNTLESDSSIPKKVPARMMPIAGEQLSHFFGFAEEDFRIFDFFMGMVDAREYVSSQNPEALELLTAADRRSSTRLPLVTAPEFDCFNQQRLSMRRAELLDVDRIDACQRIDGNLRALLQASMDLRARAQTELPPGTTPSIDDFLVAIEKHGYRYKQLEYRGRPATADTAMLALRESAQALIQELGSKQPWLEQYPVSVLGKAAANQFVYLAPRSIWNFGVLATGGAEVGWTKLFSPLRRLALGPSVVGRFLRWEKTWVVEDDALTYDFAVITSLSASARLEWALGPRLQLDLMPGLEMDYVSQRQLWHPHYAAFGWSAQVEEVFYQRLYLFQQIYQLPFDTRSNSVAHLEGDGRGCCPLRGGLGLRFFGL